MKDVKCENAKKKMVGAVYSSMTMTLPSLNIDYCHFAIEITFCVCKAWSVNDVGRSSPILTSKFVLGAAFRL
jgi:hypothetical protein